VALGALTIILLLRGSSGPKHGEHHDDTRCEAGSKRKRDEREGQSNGHSFLQNGRNSKPNRIPGARRQLTYGKDAWKHA
jgi:hypothetical protein